VTRVRITTPVPDHTGIVGNVWITDGVGFADSETHASEIAYCRANGYTIEELEAVELRQERHDLGYSAADVAEMEAEDAEDADKLPRRNGSVQAWRDYAIAHGLPADEAEALTRDQLVERFTSNEETS
jgi:hypothetical protein